MKTFKTIVLLLLFAVNTSNAQFGGLLKKSKKKSSKKESTKKEKKSTSEKSTNAEKDLTLDWNTYKLTPSITFNSLLYGTTVNSRGSAKFQTYTATFIPSIKEDGSKVSPIYDFSKFLKIKVFKDNNYVTYFQYDGSQTFDNGKKRKYNPARKRYQRDNGEWVDSNNIDLKKLGVGNYRLDFYAGDKKIQSFDFEIYKKANDDPYSKINEIYLSKGPWNKYTYITNGHSNYLVFGVYLNHTDFMEDTPSNKKPTKKLNVSLNLFKESNIIASKKTSFTVSQGTWKEFTTTLKDKKSGKFLKISELTDGNYKFELKIDGEESTRKYSFTVKNSKIQLIAEQDRNKNTEPTKLIEGWNDFFWLKRE